VKLGDFGISRIKDDGELCGQKGTPSFMAPEVISGELYDGKLADLYSVGATIYCVRFGQPAFTARSKYELFHRVLHEPVRFPDFEPVSNDLENLIQGLMTKNPSLRMTMVKLLTYPWLQTKPTHIDETSWKQDAPTNSLATNHQRVIVTNQDIFSSIRSITLE